jgi:hypothetical protein
VELQEGNMADGPWAERSLFIETEVSEKKKVTLGMNLTEGTYTIQEAEAIIRRMQRGVRQAKLVRDALKTPTKRSKK